MEVEVEVVGGVVNELPRKRSHIAVISPLPSAGNRLTNDRKGSISLLACSVFAEQNNAEPNERFVGGYK